MSALFSKPSTPTLPPTPPPAPTVVNTDTDIAAREQMLKLQRGRSATLLTGGAGVAPSAAASTSKTLLGT
jgi:hypothetical protein